MEARASPPGRRTASLATNPITGGRVSRTTSKPASPRHVRRATPSEAGRTRHSPTPASSARGGTPRPRARIATRTVSSRARRRSASPATSPTTTARPIPTIGPRGSRWIARPVTEQPRRAGPALISITPSPSSPDGTRWPVPNATKRATSASSTVSGVTRSRRRTAITPASPDIRTTPRPATRATRKEAAVGPQRDLRRPRRPDGNSREPRRDLRRRKISLKPSSKVMV